MHDDRLLFEFLILEGAQAGLSWTTILKKRENYRRAFDNFDAQRIQICWFHDLLRFHASRRPGERSLAGLFPVFANQGRRVALEPVLKLKGVPRRGILVAAKAARPAHPRSGL